ncbi:MAG: hypothetical protein WC841_03315 [Candidatus Shapirobacteria bacterium]|jgi:hypothetical protein
MIKKRVEKIAKLSILVGAKQAWKLLCNLYLLSYQPFLTLRTIKESDDKLQLILLLLAVVSPAVFYVTTRVVWDNYKYGRVLNSVGQVFLVVFVVEVLIFSYLLYWSIKVIRSCPKKTN